MLSADVFTAGTQLIYRLAVMTRMGTRVKNAAFEVTRDLVVREGTCLGLPGFVRRAEVAKGTALQR
jgi:hypothetical protein